ncbi:hypothetical protein B7P43_G05489 [Cryptotermes secundus]|nr:protein suppressor of hairy wing isoform X3 [Cryptotermes secundus]XP_023706621.1 protein suppressor of hairy wing isoform X3 [Cryptotermes secundus]XP_023706622.1 protein suppressor of hairy wing isoform X3 [Cryptotermes secundus]XP_023706623.1 protein suppressor of hairy wing isoform X3 [Cryptotermes secundus]PNF34715.1 hypothetical protein B7P43_G05489 [Cryptotermes secundus]
MLSAVMNCHILDLITDHRVARVLDMLQCLATRTPRIVLGRVEETFPSLRHNVSIELNTDRNRQTLPSETVTSDDTVMVIEDTDHHAEAGGGESGGLSQDDANHITEGRRGGGEGGGGGGREGEMNTFLHEDTYYHTEGQGGGRGEEEGETVLQDADHITDGGGGGGGGGEEEEEAESDIIPLEDTNCDAGGIAEEGCETAVQKNTDHFSEEERKSDGHQQMDRDYVNEGEDAEKIDVLPHCNDSQSNEPATRSSDSTGKAKGRGVLYVCNICNVQYKYERALRTHKLQLHHILINVDKLYYYCKICKKPFASEYNLKRHQITKHVPVAGDSRHQYECEICKMSLASEYNLQRHKITKHIPVYGDSRQQYECKICKQSFVLDSTLKRHTCAQNFPVMAMVLNVRNHCSYVFVSDRYPSSV